MKPLYVVLIALGTGILGFLAGGGLGLLGGGVAGVLSGAVGGMCLTVDTAVAEKVMTEAEVEKLGGKIGEIFRTKAQNNPNITITTTDSDKLKVEPSSTVCDRFLNSVKQGLKGQ